MKKTLTLVLILSLVLGLFVAFPAFAAEAETVTAEWKPGQLYDEAEPVAHTKRYYTVIPCKEGDVFEFDASSGNWSGWMYPADDNGAISSSIYFEMKLGQKLTYTVKAEDGKMPTKLRLTVFTKDKVDITEDIWKTFDMKITKTAAVVPEKTYPGVEQTLDWKPGAFYNTAEPNVSQTTTRRYVVVPCAEGDVISVVSPSNGWQLWIYPADADGSIEGKYYGLKSGDTYTVEAINGKMPTTLRITAHLREDAVLPDDVWAARDLVILSDRIIEEEPPATSDASTVALALTAFAALAVVTGVVVLRKRTVRG